MTEEIKEILDNLYRYKDEDYMKYQPEDILTIEDVWLLLDYITNIQQKDFESQKEITKLKDKLEQQRKEYQDTYKDVSIEIKEKNERIAKLQQDLDKANDIIEKDRQFYKCRMDEYVDLKKENEKLKNFITNLISELNHCELNRTKKLDIVSDYIKQEYEKVLNGSDEK